MDTGKATSRIAVNKAQETLHFRYLKFLVINPMGNLGNKLVSGRINHPKLETIILICWKLTDSFPKHG